jgi:hypothetical protein
VRKLIVIIILLVAPTLVKAQSYIYQYVDPCTKNIKFISVPLGGSNIAVTYYGQVGTFSSSDFSNGNFVAWLNQTSGTNAGRPCDQATTQAVNQTNMAITNNIISTLTNITSISTMAAGLSANVASTTGSNLGNTVSNGSSGDGSGNGGSGNSRSRRNNNAGSNGSSSSTGSGSTSTGSSSTGSTSTGSSSTGSTSTGSSSTGSTSTGGTGSSSTGSTSTGGTGSTSTGSGSTGQGSTGSGSTGSGSTGGTGTTGTGSNGSTNTGGSGSTGGTGATTGTAGTAQSTSGGGSGGTANSVSNATEAANGGSGGTSNSVSNAAESTSGEGSSSGGGKKGDKNRAKTGALIGTGDIVAVQSTEEGEREQFRFTMSMTKSNTKNTFARGFLGNFTTQINNSNITIYGAWTLPKSKTTIITANSSMLDLKRDFFNTTTLLASKRFTKLSLMGGVNFTAGKLGETGFQNLSAVGGGFYMFKVGKKVNSTLLMLGVYSPYTQFYEGNWWSSGVLIVPFSSWDYSITKKFKFNLSFSGTYELNKNMLNYQILTGGKVML